MKNKLAVFAALSALFVLIAGSEQVILCSRDSLELCLRLIIPGLFPFFIISGLLSALGFPQFLSGFFKGPAEKLFHVSGAGFSAFFMGICGGYPLGAAAVSDLLDKGSIGKNEAERLLCFCNNSGPAFIMGAVGAGVFKSPKCGIILYLVHILAALLCGIILRGKERCSAAPAAFSPLSFSEALSLSVRSGVINILSVCGFVVCFGVFSGLLESSGLLPLITGLLSRKSSLPPQYFKALLTGLIELSSGFGAMEGLEANPVSLGLSAFLLGFGGVSVHFQSLALFADKNINSSLHFTGCCLKAVLSSILAYFAATLFL